MTSRSKQQSRVTAAVLLVVFTIALVTGGCHAHTDFTLYTIDRAEERGAVCNDGGAAGYYFREGSGSGKDTWLFHLMGGFWCWDEESCAKRREHFSFYTSLKGYPPQWTGPSGIFVQNEKLNPHFYNANQVYVIYCSSDAWSGDTAQNDTRIFPFRGKRIVQAVVEDVYQFRGLRESSYDRRILFSGCSAGGVGVLVNANFVQKTLQDLFHEDTRILALADAAFLFDYPLFPNHALRDHVFNTTIIPAAEQLSKGYALWNGQIDAACASAFSKKPENCYFGQYAYPYIQTPMLINQEQYDAWQLDWNIGFVPSQYDSNMETYADNFRLNTVELLAVTTKKSNTVFSGMCFSHCSTESANFWQIRLQDTNRTSLSTVLGPWWEANGTTQPTFYFDHCGHFNCTIGCPPPEF